MSKVVVGICLCTALCFAQYTVSPAGAPPAEASSFSSMLAKEGVKIAGPGGLTLELWFRDVLPSGSTAKEDNATLATIPHGALLGVLRVTGAYVDRRGQTIKPGLYTLRYSLYPPDGNHQGVSPQRDFLILGRLADDTDPKSTPAFDPLMDLSRKASGTPHPLCLSLWKGGSGDNKIAKEGEEDWVLSTKIGDTPVSIIVAGVFRE
jgi:hypothetical protein